MKLLEPLSQAPGTHRGRLACERPGSGRLERTFLYHLPPAYDPSRPLPALVVLHGGRSTAWEIRGFTGLDKVADREGFVAIYPNAVENRWNDGRDYGENVRRDDAIDDVAFLGDLFALLPRELAILPDRITLTGASNGGMMALRVATETPDRIAGVAPVIASMPESVLAAARASDAPAAPVPILLMASTEDPLVPWHGGDVLFNNMHLGRIASVDDTVAYWVERNGCDPTPVEQRLPDEDPTDGMRVEVEHYAGGPTDADVILYRVVGAGHTWPGGRQYMPVDVIGPTCRDIDANTEIHAFLSRQSR